MLVQFSARNYRSIKNKAMICMLAGKDLSHKTSLIGVSEKQRLLPATAIYGPNSAGKSNILSAIQTMRNMVAGGNVSGAEGESLPYYPFMLTNDSPKAPTEFEILFYSEGVKYAYAFSYDADRIITETLYHWPKGREALIFSRVNDKYTFRDDIHRQTVMAKRTPVNKLYLALSRDASRTKHAYQWFPEKLLVLNSRNEPEITADIVCGAADDIPPDRVRQMLLWADLGITNIEASKPQNDAKSSVLMLHRIERENGSENFQLPLECESEGTQRFFSYVGPWLTTLENGGTLLIDDFDTNLHTILIRRLVEMFQDSEINKNKAQLIFTTHDVTLLDLSLLRRDQIWFTDKDPGTLATEIFSLGDFSARKDEKILKGYLQGRYGAIPSLKYYDQG